MTEGWMRNLPGRERDLDELAAICANVKHSGGGRTVFVAGDDGAGRPALMRALAEQLSSARPTPVIIAGGFEDGQYVAWERDPSRKAKAVAALDRLRVMGQRTSGLLGDFGVPYAGLVAQVLAISNQPFRGA